MSTKTSSSSSVVICTTSSSSRSEVVTFSSSPDPTNRARATAGQESADDTKRLKALLDIMEEHLQDFYKSLLELQKKRDHLVLLMNLIKHDKSLKDMMPIDRADVDSYMQIVERRLYSVDLFISQSKHVNSLLRLNELINSMISLDDLTKSHKYCELYLKAYRRKKKETESISNIFAHTEADIDKTGEKDAYKTLIQTEFKALLTGCTANDRKNIRKRLMAIMKHLEFQITNRVT